MTTLFLDTESFSACDLKKHGTHRYAEHCSTEITVAQWAVEDDEPEVEDLTGRVGPSEQLAQLLYDDTVTIVAHNSFFDRNLIAKVWGIDVPVERWHCTMAQALAHGLPGSLGKVGELLGVSAGELKDKRGTQLIQLFCKPRPKNALIGRASRTTHPTEWAEFLEYSRQDIVSMRAIYKRLPKWNYRPGAEHEDTPGGREYRLWCLDQTINSRGMHIDLDLANAAVAAADAAKASLRGRVSDATEGAVGSATQRDVLLAYILGEHGVSLPDMSSDTLKRRMEDPELPQGVRELLAMRLEASMGSAAKYAVAVRATSTDSRLRGTAQFAGAQRTSRWAHRMFQPGNMKRPDRDMKKTIESIIQATKLGVLDLVEAEPMRALANAVRGCITAAPYRKLVISDLANIEGRMLAWLAGEQWKLDAFARYDQGTGEDLYKVAYGRSFGVDPASIDDYQRQIGKVMELGLGYQGGVGAFITFAIVYGLDLNELALAVWKAMPKAALDDATGRYHWTIGKGFKTFGLPEQTWVACQALVTAWRLAHPEIVQLWAQLEDAMVKAAVKEGVSFPAGRHIKVQRDGPWTRVRLPSGRCLCYLHLKLDGSGKLSYAGVNQYTRQWGRIHTYGGKLAENITQAAARDVLAENMPAAEAADYPIVLTVHDELVTEPEDSPDYSVAGLSEILATVPSWATGLPLAAAGFETYRYRKD